MNSMKAKSKRTAIAALVLALMWMFLLPMQAFAEEGADSTTEGSSPAVVSTEGDTGSGGGGTDTGAAKTETTDSSNATASTGTAYLAPSIDSAAEEGNPEEGNPEEGNPEEGNPEEGNPEEGNPEEGNPEEGNPEEGNPEEGNPEAGNPEEGNPEEGNPEEGNPEEGNPEEGNPEEGNPEAGNSGGAVTDTAGSGDWVRYDNNDNANAIQQAVDAAIAAGQKYITVVVQDGTYTGGLTIDNSGKETIVVNIIAHDAYEHSETDSSAEAAAGNGSGTTTGTETTSDSTPAADALYPVPTNSDGTVDTSAINTGSAGGVKLEGGVSVQNVELLLAGIYLTLREQKENQGKLESMFTDEGNVDVKVENADNFTYYGTAQGDTANITLTDVKNTTIDTGDGDDVLDVSTTTSPNVELDMEKTDAELNGTFNSAASADSNIRISTGKGNDKVTVTENSKVTNKDNVISVRKGENTLTVQAGDGADTITLKGGSNIVDIKKNISEEIANKVYAIVSVDVIGHGSTAEIAGGAGDDLLNLDTTWELGTLGKTDVNYEGGTGKNRLHLTGTLDDERDNRVSGTWSADNGSGNISMHSKHTVSRTDYGFVDLLLQETYTELQLKPTNALDIVMSSVDAITDDLSGKKTVDVTIDGGGVWVDDKAVEFEAFTDYIYDPDEDSLYLKSFSNTSGGGLLSKLIIKAQNLTVNQGVQIHVPNITLVLESENNSYEGGSILIEGSLRADNIMIKLTSTDSKGISFVEMDEDTGIGMDPSIMDVNTSATVTIAKTAQLVATRVVDILAKSIQNHGLLPDLTDLIPGLSDMTESDKVATLNGWVKKLFGFDSLEMLEQAASINFVSIKMASALVDILGNIVAGSVRVSANNTIDSTAANSALRDLGLPFALSVVLGEAGITVSDNASIIANAGDIYLDAQSDVKVNTTALSGRLPFTVAVSVVDNKAYVDINGGTLKSTNGNIIANANGTVDLKTAASGSNVRPNNNAVVPSTDNQASNTTTNIEMGKSGGFFAISVLNQNVFSALQGAANAIAAGDITVNSTAKASVVNQATSNPGEDGESMTLAKLIKTLAGDEEVESDGGLFGKIKNAIEKYYNGKKNQTESEEAKRENEKIEKQKNKKTSAIGSFLDKLTGNGDDSDGDDVGSLVDKATSSANSGKTDSTSSVQLVGALGITYANNDNKAFIDTKGEVNAAGKLSVLANGEMNVETLADGSPVEADDPAGGDGKNGPQDQHFAEHSHGVIKVAALTNGTIIMDASVGKNENGIVEVVENNNFPKGIDGFELFNFVVKACFGYKLEADEEGKYWITNEYKRDSDDSDQTEKIQVELVGKDADGCYIYKSMDNSGYGGCKVYNGRNVFKAEFVPKQSIKVESNDALGTVEISDAQADGRKVYYADQDEVVYIKVNIKSGVTFTAPYITYLVKDSATAQPVDVLKITEDVEEDGTKTFYYSFKMPEGNVTIDIPLAGDDMNIKMDLEDSADRVSDVWITPADKDPGSETMEKDSVYTAKVGDKIKIVIQLANNTFLVKNSLMFAGKTPVYIKDITYDGDGQYTCYVNIPAILKTEGDETAGSDLKLTFQTTVNQKEAQGTVESTSTALGAGLAVDVTRYNNQAYIANVKNNTLTAGSVAVKANTASLSASATSKAGFVAGDLGVAGAITVHLVSANNEALIGNNNADQNGGIEEIVINGGDLVVDSVIQNSNIVTNAQSAGDGADGKNIDPNSVGVGAGIAVGVTNLAVVSKILDTVSVSGTIGDLNINAGHTGTESMTASAGASGGTSAVPVLAMNISGVSVLADSGRMLNNVMNLTGDAVINAANSITRNITADAAAVGGGVGVGGSFIIDILNDSAKAKLGRGVKTNGNITVSADSVSRLNATAKAGAKGSVSDDDGNGGAGDAGNGSGASGEEPPPSGGSDNKVDLPDDYYDGLDNLFGEGSTDNELTEEDDAESLAPLFKEGDADQFVDSNKQSAQDLSNLVANNNGNVNSTTVGNAFENRQKAETSEGSVQVAATMVLNIQNNTALAQIDKVTSIEAGDKVSVTSRHDTDGVIMANASATNSTTGVGVAVAINTVTYSNVAEILTNSITAGEIVVRANVYEEEAKETAEGFFEAIKNDVLSTADKIKDFISKALEASDKGDLDTFIANYLGDRAVETSKEVKSGIAQLIIQWIGELLQGKTPSFPTSQQEDKVKEEVTKYAKAIFDKVKNDFSIANLKKLLLGKDGAVASLKKKLKEIKNINLKEQATKAVVHYLAGKLGGNEEAAGVGPRISTSAVSGAGASNVGVAGSVAISVVNGTSNAYIADVNNGNMTVNGNVTVESKASQDVYTSAGASVDALGRVDKNKSATDTANSTQGGASNADAGKSVGVGAAVALSFADLTSNAGIGSGWTITAKDLVMDSEAENNVETTSVSGTDPLARTEEPTDKTDKDLTEEEKKEKEKKEAEEKAAKAMDYAVDASVSVTLIQNTVKAYLANNSIITLAGNLNMLSSQSGETNTNASGFAMGNETSVGAAVAINLAFSDVVTQVLGSGTVAGNASLDSKTENQDDANALALAMGADMDRYMAKLRNSEKVMAFNKKKEEEKKEEDKKDEEDNKDEASDKDDDKKDEENKVDSNIENKTGNMTGNKITSQLKRASEVSNKEEEDKSDPSQPLSVQAIKSQNVKTESTNQTDAEKNNAVGNTVTDATNGNNGNAVSGTLNEQAQEGQSVHVAASVGVNVTEHSAKTEIKGNLTVGGLKADVENSSNFSTASTGAAISKATNSNCVGAAVAVSVNGNKAVIEIPDGVTIIVTGTPAADTEEKKDSVVGNVALSTVLNQNSTGDALGRYGVLSVAGSSSGKGGKVGLAGSVAVLVAKGTSAIILGNNVTITGNENGSVSIDASDKSKLSAAAMAATKSDGSTAGVGASFALLYAQNEVLAAAGDNFSVSAKDFSMTATKQAVDITDFKPDASVSDFITVLEVDSNGNGGYETDDADKYGMIVLQKNKNGSYSVFTNLDTGNILNLIQLTSVLASVNYYASAVAGTVMERKGDTSNQKAAVAGAVSMLFNDSITNVSIGNNAKITTTGETKIKASSETNTRLLGGALSSSGAKAGIGLNVATVKQNDKVAATIGNASEITADTFLVYAESISDMLVITAAAVNASGTSVGGALNVVINNTGAEATVADNAMISASDYVEIISNVKSNVSLGSVTVSISGSQSQGASVGAIISVTTNDSNAVAILGNNAVVTSGTSITIKALNAEQVISVLAAAARSGNGGAGAGTVSVLTTDAKTIAAVGNGAKLIAGNDIEVSAMSNAKLIDLMLAAAASTDAPAVGATIMVNVFNRETGAYIGNNSVIISKLGNVLVQADSNEIAVIVSIAGAAASQNAISGNIQVNVGNSETFAIIGENANIKAWDSIGVTANQDSTVVAISPTVSYGSGSAAVGATVQTNILGSNVKAEIGQNANLIAYAQPSNTNGVQIANRETKRKGVILSALAKDLVVSGGVSASAGKNAVAGVVETMINKTVVLAKLGANAVVKAGFQSGDTADGAFSGNTPSEQEGELSAEADSHSTLVLFGGAFSATSSTGVGATVLTLVYDKSVDAQILLSTVIPSDVNGNVNVAAKAEDIVALVSVNFGVSTDTAANVGGNVLIFQNEVNAELAGNLTATGNVTVQADSLADLINAVASVSGGLGGTAVSGAALVTYFQGTTIASVGAGSNINCADLNVLATSTANINSDGVGLTASVGSAAVSGLVNVIVTSTTTKAYIDDGSTVTADNIAVIATDNYDLLAVAVSLSGGSNGIGVTAVVTVAKNTVHAYIGDNATVKSATLTVKAISNRNIRNYAGSVAAGSSAGVGATVMVAVIGGKLDKDSANAIEKGFKPDVFMAGIQASVPNAAKGYLTNMDLENDLEADDSKASDLHVGDSNGNYNGTDDYRSDEFDKNYKPGTNPGENFSGDVSNTQGSELGMAKPEGDHGNEILAYIGSGSVITVSGNTLIEANEKLNVDIVTASASVGGTAGVNVGVAVVVAYSNVRAKIRSGAVLDCADITVHAISGGDGSIDADKAAEVLDAAGIDATANGSSIRVIAVTVGIGGTAGLSPSVAVVNMASSSIARMDGVSGSANVLTVKAETIYPQVLAVTGAIGAGGSAGISASVAVVTFNSDTDAGIINSGMLTTKDINVLSNVNNTAKAYAMSLGGGTVGVNGGVAVVTNRSTTKTELGTGKYEISGNVKINSAVNTNAESFIVGVALGGVAVGLNAAVVNQHAEILTQILGDRASSLVVSGNVTVSNDITATAKSTVISVAGGGIGVGGNVLLVFNDMDATAAIIDMPFTVSGDVTVSANMKADSVANLAAATVGGVAVGLSTSYVGLNAKNVAMLEIPKGMTGSAASIQVYAGDANHINSFDSTASTVAGTVGAVAVGLNAAVADINASNKAMILSKGTLIGSVDVQANSAAAAQAEIYFVSAGGINVAAATAVSLLRIKQLAEVDIVNLKNSGSFNVSSMLNESAGKIPSYAKLVTVSGGVLNASANVAVAYSLSESIANAILHNATNVGNIMVNSSGSADAKSETLNQSVGVFNGSVYVNVAYAKGTFESVLRVLGQVSADNATVQNKYTTNSYADLTPTATNKEFSVGSFSVNLAIAKAAANALAALEGNGKLVLSNNLLVKADGSNSRANANINGASVSASGFTFGANIADSQMAMEQTVRIDHITVDAGGKIEVIGNANNLVSNAETGANFGVSIKIVGGTANSANANVSAVNQIILDYAKLTAAGDIMTKADSANLAVNAIAKALTFELTGISVAVTTTEAKVTRFNTGVFVYNTNAIGSNVEFASTANGSKVVAQSSVPLLSGSVIGIDNILASAKILEKLTQVIVDAGIIQSTAADVILKADADAVLKADSARPAASFGAISVKDYQFNIDVNKILTEVIFDGQIDAARDAKLDAYDKISADIYMDDTTIGGFSGTASYAKIEVKNQTAYVKAVGMINVVNNIKILAKADQNLKAYVDTDSTNFNDFGYVKTDIILYRNAIVDVDGSLISKLGNIDIHSKLGTKDANNKVIDLDLDVSIDTWIDSSTYPTGTGKLVSVAKVNVAEGSLIEALNVFGENTGSINIESKSEGCVLVDVYRYVDKPLGGNRAYSIVDVNETVHTNIGGSAKTKIHGKNVNIRARSEMDVRSISYAYGNTVLGIYYPNAIVNLGIDMQTILHAVDVSAYDVLNISAYLLDTYVLGHCTSHKDWATCINSPSVNIEGYISGDVTFDTYTVLRANSLNIKTFHPDDTNRDNRLVIARKAECRHGDSVSYDEDRVFNSNTAGTDVQDKKYKGDWDKFSKDKKFIRGTYNANTVGKNNVYYRGSLYWQSPSLSGIKNPSGKMEIYLGAGATGIYVDIDSNGNVDVKGLSTSVSKDNLVNLKGDVYHVDGSKLQSTSSKGSFSFKYDYWFGSHNRYDYATNSDLILSNASNKDVQLDNVNKNTGTNHLAVTQSNANANLILNRSGNFSKGSIFVDLAGGDLILMNGAQINAQNIVFCDVGSIVDEGRKDGKVVITNSSSTGNDADSSIHIAVEDALNLILQSTNSRYTIDQIQSNADLTLDVKSTAGKEITVLLGELISGGNVTVKVPDNVESADANKVNISGNAITLNAGGMVGTASEYLRIDSSVNDIGGVTVIGSGGIYLKEADGDLYITEIRNDGTGNIALWTQNGNINVDPNVEYSDAIEKLNGSLMKYAEYGVIWSDAEDMIEILVQYLRDLIRIQNALKTEGEEVLSEVKMEIDVLHDVTSVEEALAIIAEQLLLVGGTNYQDPDAVEDMMTGAVTGSVLTDEFKATVENLASNPELAGLLSEQIIIWADSFEQVNRYMAEVLLFAALLDAQKPIISGNGDLLLHLESADGTASVSQEKNSLSISIGGKVTITTGPETELKDVYLESYDRLTLDPIVATDVIDLYSLNGIYAAKKDQVLLDADKLMLWSLLDGDLGTSSQALILNANLLSAFGNNVYLQNGKDLVVDIILAFKDLYLTVKGDLYDLQGDDAIMNGIHSNFVNLNVSGNVGDEDNFVTISSDGCLNITAENIYMSTDGDVKVGTIRANGTDGRGGMVAIYAYNGSIQNTDQGTGIWCKYADLDAYGMIGTKENPVIIHRLSEDTSPAGAMERNVFRMRAPVRVAISADSYLYGENILIIPVQDSNTVVSQLTTVICGNTGIKVTGKMTKDAVLVVSDVSDHVDCPVCQLLKQYHQNDGRIFVNLKLLGDYVGKLLVQIPVTEELAEYEGQEIVVLLCRDGIVWAVRATVTNGFITFYTEELGSFLVLGHVDQLKLTEEGTGIVLDQTVLPFGGWL